MGTYHYKLVTCDPANHHLYIYSFPSFLPTHMRTHTVDEYGLPVKHIEAIDRLKTSAPKKKKSGKR